MKLNATLKDPLQRYGLLPARCWVHLAEAPLWTVGHYHYTWRGTAGFGGELQGIGMSHSFEYSANMITSKGEPIFAHVNMHGFRWKFMAPSSSRAQNSVMKIAERSSLKILPSPNTTHYHSRQSSRCGCFSPGWNPTQPMHVSFNSDLKYVSQNKLTRC